jgi:hypothetical protein
MQRSCLAPTLPTLREGADVRPYGGDMEALRSEGRMLDVVHSSLGAGLSACACRSVAYTRCGARRALTARSNARRCRRAYPAVHAAMHDMKGRHGTVSAA